MILPPLTGLRTPRWPTFGYPDDVTTAAKLTIHFIEPDGSTRRVQARAGQSLMQVAVDAGVTGVAGLCGGDMCCATCVVRPAPGWVLRLSRPVEDEQLVVQGMPTYHEQDRLGCQIRLDASLDGLVVFVP
jgi:2Fe-2S ferredoxin